MITEDIVLTYSADTRRFSAVFRPHPTVLSDIIATDPQTIAYDAPQPLPPTESPKPFEKTEAPAFTSASSLVLDTPIWQKYLNYHTPVTFAVQNAALVQSPAVSSNCGRFFPPRPRPPSANGNNGSNNYNKGYKSQQEDSSETIPAAKNGTHDLLSNLSILVSPFTFHYTRRLSSWVLW